MSTASQTTPTHQLGRGGGATREPSRAQSARGASRATGLVRRGRGGRQFGALLTPEDGSEPQQEADSPADGRSPALEAPSSDLAPGLSNGGPSPHLHKKSSAQANKRKKAGIGNSATADKAEPKPNGLAGPLAHEGHARSKGSSKAHEKQASGETDASGGGEMCFICAEPIKYFALGSCSHRTCHVCTLRMRALYKKRDCALCKTHLPDVIFTVDPEAAFTTFDLPSFRYNDPHLSIYCETYEQLTELLSYLNFNCPHPECSAILSNWRELKHHTISSHGLIMCDMCCSNKKVFAHEHTLFTNKGLTVHINQGSVGIGKGIQGSGPSDHVTADTPGVVDGFKGHPRCGFCSIHFYDDDLLYQHCREKHEQCFICVRNGVGRWQYYLDYKHLETHFRDDHYLCCQTACLQARFMVYETAVDLQAHQIEAHGAELGVRAVKDARKLETNFVYAGSSEHHAQGHLHERGRRDQRAGQGAMRVMNIAPIGGGVPTTLSNADRVVPGLAPNRGAASERRRDKGKLRSTLTVDGPENHTSQSSSTPDPAAGPSETFASTSKNDPNLQRHAALIQRVREAVNGVETKVTSFKAAVRTYRNNEMAAGDLLDTMCHIFEYRAQTIGPIFNSLLDLLDVDNDKKAHLLERWRDLRLDQTQFPSLNGHSNPAVPQASSYLTVGLHPARADATGQSTSWVRQHVGGPSSGSLQTNQFPRPGEGPAGRGQKKKDKPAVVGGRGFRSGVSSTPWASGSGGGRQGSLPTTTTATLTTAPRPSVTVSKPSAGSPAPLPGPKTSAAHFPSLPTNQAILERQSKVKEALSKGIVGAGSSSVVEGNSQWTTASASSNNASAKQLGSNGTGGNQSGGGNGKKGKKMVLFTNAR